MKIQIAATRERVSAARRRAYLAAWPLEAQAEAHAEAAAGRRDKLTRMLADMAAIRDAHPYREEME